MDFGKLPDVDDIRFKLPKDPIQNDWVLKGAPYAKAKIYIGCPSYNHPEWIGKVYAPGKRNREFLAEYVHQFNSIEVNATAYKIPELATIQKWHSLAPKSFKYCVKFPQTITHYGKIDGKPEVALQFAHLMDALKYNCGPPLLQFSDRFSPKRWEEVVSFLKTYPGTINPAVEVRHKEFFQKDNSLWMDQLHKLKVPLVITDTPGRQDVLHMRLTTPIAFIRFNGHGTHQSNLLRLNAWAKRIGLWLKKGLKQVYFFVHTHPKLYCPDLANYFANDLAKHTQLPVKKWQLPTPKVLS